jgi:transcriptional regulator with XRE-family HTH domain
MTGTSNWRTIREKRVGNDPDRVARARESMIAELRLAGLRKHRKASQTEVAKRLAVSQANVSQIERGDVKVSTLASYVDALGGELEMHAVFADERVPLSGIDMSGVSLKGAPVTRTKTRSGKLAASKPRRAKASKAKAAKAAPRASIARRARKP